jgi:2'-5' RNA ligase
MTDLRDEAMSAVIVAVPEAEPLVGGLRAALDKSAGWGVPAHVTVLFPFLPPTEIDDAVLAGLADVVGRVPAFTATFPRVGWFGGDVLWLAPEPSGLFVRLTLSVQERFGLVPYGGAHGPQPVPHLTVGHDAPVERLRAAAAAVASGLPLRAGVASVRVITGRRAPGAWSTLAELPLGNAG